MSRRRRRQLTDRYCKTDLIKAHSGSAAPYDATYDKFEDRSGSGNYSLVTKAFSVVPVAEAERPVATFANLSTLADRLRTPKMAQDQLKFHDVTGCFDILVNESVDTYAIFQFNKSHQNKGFRLDIKPSYVSVFVKNLDEVIITTVQVTGLFTTDEWHRIEFGFEPSKSLLWLMVDGVYREAYLPPDIYNSMDDDDGKVYIAFSYGLSPTMIVNAKDIKICIDGSLVAFYKLDEGVIGPEVYD